MGRFRHFLIAWRNKRDKNVKVLSSRSGKCPRAVSGRHVIDRSIGACILCCTFVDEHDYNVVYKA